MAAEFTPEELALYILSLTVQDPDSLPEVEIAREKPLPFKYVGGGHGNKMAKVVVDVTTVTVVIAVAAIVVTVTEMSVMVTVVVKNVISVMVTMAGGNRDFKRKSKRNSKDFFNKEKKSSAKNTGFVIRHKGE